MDALSHAEGAIVDAMCDQLWSGDLILGERTDLRIEPRNNAATPSKRISCLGILTEFYWARELSRFTENRIDKIDEDRKKASQAKGPRAMFMPERKNEAISREISIFGCLGEENMSHPESHNDW